MESWWVKFFVFRVMWVMRVTWVISTKLGLSLGRGTDTANPKPQSDTLAWGDQLAPSKPCYQLYHCYGSFGCHNIDEPSADDENSS